MIGLRRSIWGFAVLVAVCTNADAAELLSKADADFFEQHIRPLFAEHCVRCHGAGQQKANLRLDSAEALQKGGESGEVIDLQQPVESMLLSAVRYESVEMPPDKPLRPKQIALLERWLKLGAPWPADSPIVEAVRAESIITEDDRSHWSFVPLASEPLRPMLDAGSWCQNPIDRFILQRLELESIRPAPRATDETLLRRVFFDVVGLPPTPQDVERFHADSSTLRYEHLVDRLLHSPDFGAKWARDWLDVVRYAESDGFRADGYRSGAWHYRDYVISAFNDDKPYDQFICEQIAGDELYPDDPTAWVGTGFLRLPIYEYNQRDVVTQRQDILNDITDVTADVFLGLGMKCARCHDHKFDPLLQADYYHLQSFFAALLPKDDALLLTPAEAHRYKQRLARWESETQEIRDQIAHVKRRSTAKQAETVLKKFTPDILAMYHKSPAERSPFETQLVYFVDRQTSEEGAAKLTDAEKKQLKALEAQLKSFEHLKPAVPATTLAVTETGAIAPETRIPGHEIVMQPDGIKVLRHVLKVDPHAHSNSQTTGRRSRLAHWIANSQNPLTARVMVNRIWQSYFGKGLVETASDFGRLGSPPSHPELLDWLAAELIRNDWQTKSIHRLILTSATYQQNSHHPAASANEAIDPGNRLLWRRPVRRLNAEQIVDAANAAAGRLDRRLGGPGVDDTDARRAIFRKVRRNSPDPFLRLFDGPDGINSTPARLTTTTSPQALAMLNDGFLWEAAKAMADRIKKQGRGDDAIKLAYRIAFARDPKERERTLARGFLQASSSSDRVDPLVSVCHALLNANEFIYVD